MSWSRKPSWLMWLVASLCIWWGLPAVTFLGRTLMQSGAPERTSRVVRSASAVAGVEEEVEEDLYVEGQEVVLKAPPAMAGKIGTVMGLAPGGAYAVRLATGSIFNIMSEHMEPADDIAQAPVSQSQSTSSDGSASNTVASSTAMDEDDEDLFQEGQEVRLLGPQALAGKSGTIVGRAQEDAYAVRLASGSVFNIREENIEVPGAGGVKLPSQISNVFSQALKKSDAAQETAAGLWSQLKQGASQLKAAVKESTKGSSDALFTEGQEVVLLSPAQLAGNTGTVVEQVAEDAYAVQLASGSVFNLKSDNLRASEGAQASGGSPTAGKAGWSQAVKSFLNKAKPTAASTSKGAATDEGEEEDLFQEGQEVRLLAPPALAGTAGTIVGRVRDDAYAVRLPSGSIFNIQQENIGAAGLALPKLPKLPKLPTQLTGGVATAVSKVSQMFKTKKGAAAKSAPAPAAPEASAPGDAASKEAAQVSEEGDEDLFTEGQPVAVLAPPAMAGKTGTIVKPVQGGDAYAVRLESGSVFNIDAENLAPGKGSGGGSGGRGFGGGGSGGSGGAGKPPGGVGSSPQAGGSGEPGVWTDVLVFVCVMSVILLAYNMAFKRSMNPRHRRRVDIRQVFATGSSVDGPLAALLLLAAAVYLLLPKISKFFEWLQGHLQEKEVTESPLEMIVENIIPLKKEVKDAVKVQGQWDGLAIVASVIIILVLMYRIKKNRAFSVPALQKAAQQEHQGAALKSSQFMQRERARSRSLLPPLHTEPEATSGGRSAPSVSDPLASCLPLVRPRASSRPPREPSSSVTRLLETAPAELGTPRTSAQKEGVPGRPATVRFEVELDAQYGDRLLVVGGDPNLGAWDPEATKVELRTDNDNYPVWSGTWSTTQSLALHKYKLAIKKATGKLVWEEIDNRSLYVMPGKVTVKLIFNSSFMADPSRLAALAG